MTEHTGVEENRGGNALPVVDGARVADEVAKALRLVMDVVDRVKHRPRLTADEIDAFAAATIYQDTFCGKPGKEGDQLWASFVAGVVWERLRRRP